MKILVQWENLSKAEATWEDFALLAKHFRSLNLEDKVRVNAGGNVMISDLELCHHSKNALNWSLLMQILNRRRKLGCPWAMVRELKQGPNN